MPVDEHREKPLLLMQDYIQEIEILHDAHGSKMWIPKERVERKRIAFCGCIE
jgi:hypothetical protein